MCILIAFHDSVPDCPIVIGANRDEFYDRPSRPPALLGSNPCVWGGSDERAGGTWLGVNQRGLLIALTNRRKQEEDPKATSRGLLCRRLLDCSDCEEVKDRIEDLTSTSQFNPCNLYFTDGEAAWLGELDGLFVKLTRCPPGVIVVGNGVPNDPDDIRVARALNLISDAALESAVDAMGLLKKILPDHQNGVSPGEMICVHGVDAGTVSSSILAIWPERMAASRYLHLEGTPCAARYTDYSGLFHETPSR
jgi:uncharacterized protein with NRDE domain